MRAVVMIIFVAACTSAGNPTATPPITVVATAPTATSIPLGSRPTTAAAPASSPTEATPTPIQAATLAPTLTAAPSKPEPVGVVRFHQIDETVIVEIANPNAEFGLVRAGFEMAVIGDDGSILAVAGQDGLLGAVCCTIYHLPPGGRFVLTAEFLPERSTVAAVELTVLGTWEEWSELDPAIVTVTDPRLRVEFGSGVLTGRVGVDQAGPFNPFIVAMVEGRGDAFSAVVGSPVDCIGAGQTRAFELEGFIDVPSDPELGEVYAYPTTVVGAGDVDTPPGC